MKKFKKINIFTFVVSVGILAFIGYSDMYDAASNTQHLVASNTINTSKSYNLNKKKEGSTHKLDPNLRTNEKPPKARDLNISMEDYLAARKQARQMKAAQETEMMQSKAKYRSNVHTRSLKSSSTTPSWQMRGPYTYGRVTAIVADPENPDKVYVGTPQGGVWKSTDGGEHYTPIFDHAGSLSIGSLALDPHDSDIIYVGTGECDHPSASTVGDGIWKSTDGGKTWERLGLEKAFRIGAIVVNPDDSMEIFATSFDYQVPSDSENGVFRSRDGGQIWKKISTSYMLQHIRTMQMDPENTHRLYASDWNKGLIWKSEDSGDTWKKLTNGLPIQNSYSMAFSLAPSSPNRLYVAYPASNYSYDIYRSDDYGETWEKKPALINGMAQGIGSSNYGYCGKLIVSPQDKNTFHVLDTYLYKSTDGGENFTYIGDGHVDHHSLWISPDSETIYSGNDGGIYVSHDAGDSNTYTYQSLPIGQFYAIEVDPKNHNKILGGMQDNGSGYTTNGSDWHYLSGGDGFTVLVDDINTSYIYSESQYGNVYLKSQNRFKVPNGSWHTPIVFDPSDNRVVYYGGDYLYKTTRTGNTLSKLTKVSSKKFGFMEAIEVIDIPISGGGKTIYVTTSSNIWVSRDRGNSWTKTIFKSGQDQYISRITADPKIDAISYVSLKSYSENIIYRTEDYGQTWTNISSNLPHAGVNDILVDPDYSSTLYCGTDFGVYISLNTGKTWKPLGHDLPETKVSDIKIVKEGSEIVLVAGTYGRGIYSVRLNNAQRGGYSTLTAPTNLQAKDITTNSATLTWTDNSDNETGFNIYKGTSTKPMQTVEANVTTLSLTELTADTNYTYHVKAYNSAGESTDTNTTFETLADDSIPTIDFNTTVSNTWDANTPSTHRHGKYAKFYTFTLTQSTIVTIDLMSSKDTYLFLLQGNDKNGSEITHNDDGGNGFNSRITRTLAAGTYTIEATTYSNATTGSFTLRVNTPKILVTESIITSPVNHSKVTPGSTITITWENHGATQKEFYIGARVNSKYVTIKHEDNIQSTSTTVEMPLGFIRGYLYIKSFDANNRYLGISLVKFSRKE